VGKPRTVTARVDQLAPKPRRVFGALKDLVGVDPSFFEPLPIAELEAWQPRPQKRRPPTKERLAAALQAFWRLAADWDLSTGEQCALLAVSRNTLGRWKAKAPISRKSAIRTIDRLLLILRTCALLSQAFPRTGARDIDDLRWYVRLPGGAKNPELAAQSILEMLSDRSVLAMLDGHFRFVKNLPATARLLRSRRRTQSSSRA
jgi:hypothetical protein